MTRPFLALAPLFASSLALLALAACQESEAGDEEQAPQPPAAAEDLSDVFVSFAVLGDFGPTIELDRERHGLEGMPDWLDVGPPEPLEGSMVATLLAQPALAGFLDEDPALRAAADAAPEVIVVMGAATTGEVSARVREAVAVVQAALDGGGLLAVDLQAWTFQHPETWERTVFAPERVPAGRLVRILISEEDEDDPAAGSWLHTRGLRTFGRPDVSVRGVPGEALPTALELVNRFVQMQALGHRIPEGQPISMQGVPPGMRVAHGGSLEDPAFNNVHFELRWPRD